MPKLHYFSQLGSAPGSAHHAGIGHRVAGIDCITQSTRGHGVYMMPLSRCPVPDFSVNLDWVDEDWATRWCLGQCGLPRAWWRRLWHQVSIPGQCCVSKHNPGQLVADLLLAAADTFGAPEGWSGVVDVLGDPAYKNPSPAELELLTRSL